MSSACFLTNQLASKVLNGNFLFSKLKDNILFLNHFESALFCIMCITLIPVKNTIHRELNVYLSPPLQKVIYLQNVFVENDTFLRILIYQKQMFHIFMLNKRIQFILSNLREKHNMHSTKLQKSQWSLMEKLLHKTKRRKERQKKKKIFTIAQADEELKVYVRTWKPSIFAQKA